MSRDIRLEATYPHPPERVWRALTDKRALNVWLMATDFEPVVGRAFTFTTRPAPGFDGIVRGEVLRADQPHTLSYSWRGGGIDTVVTYQLERAAGGTRLRFSQTGFAGLRGLATGWILGSGWRGMARAKLPAVLDRLARGGIEAVVAEGPIAMDKSAAKRAAEHAAATVTVRRGR